jgi:hypothetical protein
MLSVLLAIAVAAMLIPEQRGWWEGGVLCIVFGLASWLAFFLPYIVWEAHRGSPLDPLRLALLGGALGALIPLFFLAVNGEYFWAWRSGQALRLSLMAPVVGMLAGWVYSRVRPSFS